MLGWMDDEALHRTLTTGRATFFSRSRNDVLGQGRDQRTPAVGPRGAAGLRRRHAAGHRRPGGPGLPHRRPHLLRRPLAAGRGRPAGGRPMSEIRPPAWPSSGSRRRARRVIPVHRRLLADAETAIGLYRKLAGNRPGTFLLESAEQGVWSRYSFIGVQRRRDPDRARRRGGLDRARRRSACRPVATRCRRCARRCGCCTPRGPRACRRSPRVWSATSATTWSAGSSGCPTATPTTWSSPSWRSCWPPTWRCSTTTPARSGWSPTRSTSTTATSGSTRPTPTPSAGSRR